MDELKLIWRKFGRQEWLEEVPGIIKYLVDKYHFFYNAGTIIKIKDIKDVVNRRYEKNKHKIILYYNPDLSTCYLVTYCSNHVSINYCNEYDFSRWYTVKYFLEKFSKAGEIKDDYEQVEEVSLFELDR